MCRTPLSCLLLVLLAAAAPAQTALPVVNEVPWKAFRADCRRLLRALEELKTPLPAQTTEKLRTLLEKEPDDPAAAVRAVQKLLDPDCLLAVDINPESRVKAARGPARAELVRGRPTAVLVRVHNEAGVTAPLKVSGPGLVPDGDKADYRHWLRADLAARKLSGGRLQYRVLVLTADAAGKREATFRFDVGQGTQDLGFRAEVPILFRVRDR